MKDKSYGFVVACVGRRKPWNSIDCRVPELTPAQMPCMPSIPPPCITRPITRWT
jgi:hypothetical protein